ncbi:hypothetical protein EII34_10010 [Arachnia propionica]|uniref:Uncharacterized protein n=1 Tax=Arachnia propionica TaxID=1750 RepID=A0A3P1T4V9_9ACTN|nr:hypothetical protein [Arachnia propionica]RRD04390.1 hypothetical protein EII34_10010 [Arachnia propionica]
MARTPEHPDAKAVRRLVMDAGGPVALLRQLRSLSGEDRARLEATFAEHRDDIVRRLRSSEFKGELAVLMVELGVTPEQFAETVDAWFRGFIDDGDTLDALGEALIDRGPAWGQRLVDAYLSSRSPRAWVSLILDPIIITHELPLPSDADYLTDWLRRWGGPAPGRRWQELFLAACSHPDALGTPMGPRARLLHWLRHGTSILRRAEPLDDVALADALLGIIERGDRPAAQSNATVWLEGLGLVEEVWRQRERLLAMLPNAHSTVVAFACAQLLRPDLSDEHLEALAVEVLSRKEKAPKKRILKHLGRLAAPGPDLAAALQGLAKEADTTVATAAMKQLGAWGIQLDAVDELSGLWQEPLGEIEPLASRPRVLDDPGLAELITVITGDPRSSGEFEEQLADLVATAHSRGLTDVLAVLEQFDLRPLEYEYLDRPVLAEALVHLVHDEELPVPRTRQLTRLVLGHALAVTRRLGELPCLLSTPTRHSNHLTWRALLQRASRYRDLGVALEATDVLAALSRVDPDGAPSDLAALEQPIRGLDRTLAEVVRIWLRRPYRPRLEVLPPNGAGHRDGGPHMRCKLDDDKPALVVALGLMELWNAPDEGYYAERTEALRLLPGLPHRAALRILKLTYRMGSGAGLEDLPEVGHVAHPFGPVLTLACLAVASEGTPAHREEVAAVLYGAWQDGRLRAEDLVDAWVSPQSREFQLSPAKVTSMLRLLAETGALALVWPLLVVIAEELAAAEKVPATASTVFETVLALLPEVPHATELPNITALAARKGSSKAITLARAIEEKL